MHLMNSGYFYYKKKPEDPQIQPHAGIKMVQDRGSLVYICGSKQSTSFWNKIIHVSYSKLPKELKNSIIKIYVGQAVLELLTQTMFWLIWSTTLRPLGLWKIQCHFQFLEQFIIRSMCYFAWSYWDRAQNMLVTSRRCSGKLS